MKPSCAEDGTRGDGLVPSQAQNGFRGNEVGGGYKAKNHITAMPEAYEPRGGLAE